MKYKAGDVVYIQTKKWFEDNKDAERNYVVLKDRYFMDFMTDYCGLSATVKKVVNNEYYILDNMPYEWTDEMFIDKKNRHYVYIERNDTDNIQDCINLLKSYGGGIVSSDISVLDEYVYINPVTKNICSVSESDDIVSFLDTFYNRLELKNNKEKEIENSQYAILWITDYTGERINKLHSNIFDNVEDACAAARENMKGKMTYKIKELK